MIANYARSCARSCDDDSRAAGDVDQIITASRRASELTRRLLLFSRRQSGTPEVLSLRRVIESVELLLQRTLGDEIDLEVDCDDRLWDVEADRSQLEQVADEPGAELARGDARRRQAAHRGRERGHARPRQPVLARRPADRHRHRPRHGHARSPPTPSSRSSPPRRSPATASGSAWPRSTGSSPTPAGGSSSSPSPAQGTTVTVAAAGRPPRVRRRPVARRPARARRDRAWSSRTPTPCGS